MLHNAEEGSIQSLKQRLSRQDLIPCHDIVASIDLICHPL
jgi:hypothetical protein